MSKINQVNIKLVPLIHLDTESQIKIRDIRNEQNVRKWMYSDHVIGVNEHLDWINKIKQDDRQIVFAVLGENNIPLGVASVGLIDRIHKKTDWAYYLTEDARGGLGSAIEWNFINFIFDVLGVDKLNCEVIDGNDAVVKMHKKFSFQEEGYRRSNVVKNEERIGVHLLGLTKEDWLDNKNKIFETHKVLFEKFSISIVWGGDSKNKISVIDKIEAARAKNNLNWMSILRLALEKSPETAKPIVEEIKKIDRQISGLTDELT